MAKHKVPSIIGIPKGFEPGDKTYRLTTEQNFYRKTEAPAAPAKASKPSKPYVQPVRVVNLGEMKKKK